MEHCGAPPWSSLQEKFLPSWLGFIWKEVVSSLDWGILMDFSPKWCKKKEPSYLRHGDQGTLDGDVAGSVAPTCSWKMWCPMAKGMTPTWALDLDWVNMTQQKLKWQNYRLKIELIRSTLITKPENPNSSGKVNQRSRWSPEVFFWVWCPHHRVEAWISKIYYETTTKPLTQDLLTRN